MENCSFIRVDSDTISNLIKKDEAIDSVLTEKEKEKLKPLVEGCLPKEGFSVIFESLEALFAFLPLLL